jgi:hypothetical protein
LLRRKERFLGTNFIRNSGIGGKTVNKIQNLLFFAGAVKSARAVTHGIGFCWREHGSDKFNSFSFCKFHELIIINQIEKDKEV